MNQAELISAVAERTGLTKTEVEKALVAVAYSAQGALKRGDDVALPGLGKLKTVARAARTGRNPKTGAAVEIPAKTAVKFSPAKELRDAMPAPKGAKKK